MFSLLALCTPNSRPTPDATPHRTAPPESVGRARRGEERRGEEGRGERKKFSNLFTFDPDYCSDEGGGGGGGEVVMGLR